MKKIMTLSCIVFTLMLFSSSVYGQTGVDSVINESTSFKLTNDTLFSNTGLKIYIGQQLVIGSPTGEAGQYRSIISKKAALVPSIWGQDKRFENAIENYVDSRKNKEKLRAALIPGSILRIKYIDLSTTAKPHFYMAALASDTDIYRCDIKLALVLKELLLKP